MAKSIEDVKGIGPASASLLKDAGIRTVSNLATATIDRIASVKGFGKISAARVIEDAKSLLAEKKKPAKTLAAPPAKSKSTKPSSGKKKKTDKKKKDKKGDKKKDKKNKATKKNAKKKKKNKKGKKKK